jgi:hypothetical protein
MLQGLKCLGKLLANQNCIHEEIKSGLNLENAFYHSVQNILSSCQLFKNIKIRIYKNIFFPVVLYGAMHVRWGPCPHSMARPRVTDGGTASSYGG